MHGEKIIEDLMAFKLKNTQVMENYNLQLLSQRYAPKQWDIVKKSSFMVSGVTGRVGKISISLKNHDF